jgi:hypothetical protein
MLSWLGFPRDLFGYGPVELEVSWQPSRAVIICNKATLVD